VSEENRRIVQRFWEALERSDFDAAAACFGEAFVEEWPQSGERIVGAENWLGMVRTHPTFPAIRHVRTVGEGNVWATHATYDYGDGVPWQIGAIQELQDGRIARITEFFGSPFEAADWRSDLVERF
jgi:ketosteroid isomerase-like protein